MLLRIEARPFEPAGDLTMRLLHERPHRQAEDELTRPRVVLAMEAIEEPRDRDTGGLPEPGGDSDQPVAAHRI
jgi:hypothetical protein